MKLYLHIGEVEGAGKVPIDMLRYDQAFPYREADSRMSSWMVESLRSQRRDNGRW